LTLAKNNFIAKLFSKKKNSVWVAVLGRKQFGKTDFCLHLMEKLHDLNLMNGFGSNIPVEAPFHVDFIEDYKSLEAHCRMLNPNPSKQGLKRYLFFGSEMGKWLPKDRAWENVDFIGKLQTVRKYGLSWIGDAIDRVEGRVLNPTHFDGRFTKLSLKVAEFQDWRSGKKHTLRNIPKTTIKFDTWYSANFYMEPQTPENINLPLNYEHEIVKKYYDLGSWAKAGIHRQEGKWCLLKVLDFHFRNCLSKLPVEKQESAPNGAKIA